MRKLLTMLGMVMIVAGSEIKAQYYDIDLMYRGMSVLQSKIDRNKERVYDRIDMVQEAIDNAYYELDGFTREQSESVAKYHDDLESMRVNWTDEREVRSLMTWLDRWRRCFESWTRKKDD